MKSRSRIRDTRNYGKFHPRFAGGGIVEHPGEEEDRMPYEETGIGHRYADQFPEAPLHLDWLRRGIPLPPVDFSNFGEPSTNIEHRDWPNPAEEHEQARGEQTRQVATEGVDSIVKKELALQQHGRKRLKEMAPGPRDYGYKGP